jgi:hypothetical protein
MKRVFLTLLLAGGIIPGCTTTGSSVAGNDPFANQDPFQAAEANPVHTPRQDVWHQPDALAGSAPRQSAPEPRAMAEGPGWSSTRHVTHPEFEAPVESPAAGQRPVQTAASTNDPFQPAVAHASSGVATADYQAAKPAQHPLTSQHPLTATSNEAPVFVDAAPAKSESQPSTDEWWTAP